MDEVTALVVSADQLAKFMNEFNILVSTDLGVAVVHQGDHFQTGNCLVIASVEERNVLVIPTRFVASVSDFIAL